MAFMKELQHLKIQLEDIKLATDNFGNKNAIGVGGFGKVYKGILTHYKGKSMVALKRLDRKYGQGEPEFLKEIMFLSRYTHENLISLLGFCNEVDEKILVYEYASRGSLDRHLSDTTLTWKQRLKICIAAAKGLTYLHDPNRTHQRVLHCDIKSSNILLDENWNAKVSDFGLSKLGPANEQHTYLITKAFGTPGYCDPLFMESFTLTKESDVYSFGVVLFEVLCGRLCFEFIDHFKVFVSIWKERYEEKKLEEIIFQDLKHQIDSSSLKSFSDIAYQCLKYSRKERPTMSRVLEELENALEYQEIYEGKEEPINNEEMINTEEERAGGPLPKFGLRDSDNKSAPLPKFGEWDVDNIALAEGFTVIFNKVRDERVIFNKVRDERRRRAAQETPTNAYPGDAGPSKKGKKSLWLRSFVNCWRR